MARTAKTSSEQRVSIDCNRVVRLNNCVRGTSRSEICPVGLGPDQFPCGDRPLTTPHPRPWDDSNVQFLASGTLLLSWLLKSDSAFIAQLPLVRHLVDATALLRPQRCPKTSPLLDETMSAHIETRLKYLNEAAHLLNTSSPTVAAFLQTRIDALVWDDGPSLDEMHATTLTDQQFSALEQARTRRHHICGACGHMSDTPTQDATVQDSSRSVGAQVVCSKCGAKSTIQPPDRHVEVENKQAKKRTQHSGRSNNQTTPSDSTPVHSVPGAVQTSGISKKPKNRKGTSLSAMLAKSKQQEASKQTGFGLDLMDLMKGP